MKLYIPTTSLNFNNILSTESISPKGFYASRGFGYSRWFSIPENNLDGAILLYESPAELVRPKSDLEDHPLLIEIETDEVFPGYSYHENAEDFGGQKGPRMDYHLQKSDALSSDFDYVRLIKSAMSYKMAETDDVTLCFGILESLAFFLSDQSDAHKEGILSARIAFGGSLFGYKRLSEMVIKNIKPNHTICMNRELPIEC